MTKKKQIRNTHYNVHGNIPSNTALDANSPAIEEENA
jgi:hypothetical protein